MKLISLIILVSFELVLSVPIPKPTALIGNRSSNGNIGNNNRNTDNCSGNGKCDGVDKGNSVNVLSDNFEQPTVSDGLSNADTLAVKRQLVGNLDGNGKVGNNGNGNASGNGGNGNGNDEGIANGKSTSVLSNNFDSPTVGHGGLNLDNIVV